MEAISNVMADIRMRQVEHRLLIQTIDSEMKIIKEIISKLFEWNMSRSRVETERSIGA